ncbi:MAG: cysteine dioxygenase family protein [Deltaproteobacteria bacterium]|nr:cysteine dioxygenase family protein [Deltaproteobacteria bacterium]
MTSRIPSKILSFCKECAHSLSNLRENQERIEYTQELLPRLLRDTPLFGTILRDLIVKREYPDLNYPTMFDSEFMLYTDPDRLFSMRMFIWEPGAYDPIHDHNSWGVIGPVTGQLEVITYRREDDGSREGYADLIETGRKIILPGDTYFVLPLNTGIHRTGNPGNETIIQVSIYGEAQTTRNHINGFDLELKSVYPIYAPKTKKRLLAQQALNYIEM